MEGGKPPFSGRVNFSLSCFVECRELLSTLIRIFVTFFLFATRRLTTFLFLFFLSSSYKFLDILHSYIVIAWRVSTLFFESIRI